MKVTFLPVTCFQLSVAELLLKLRTVDLILKVTSRSVWSVWMSQVQSSLAHSCVSWADSPERKNVRREQTSILIERFYSLPTRQKQAGQWGLVKYRPHPHRSANYRPIFIFSTVPVSPVKFFAITIEKDNLENFLFTLYRDRF